MRRTAQDVIEIDGRSALHGIRRAFPLHPRRAFDRDVARRQRRA
jgi:hypothetical protein